MRGKRKTRLHRLVSRAVVISMRLELRPGAEVLKRSTSNRIGYGPMLPVFPGKALRFLALCGVRQKGLQCPGFPDEHGPLPETLSASARDSVR